ncbi:sensor histidine kinase [Microbacterium sp. NPDC089696]|uniref:sensor histidine kinase n=1 Tax=Microbacterium sp. NPDC089696 TaxID=3364199 RepID=UPI0038101A3C
MSFRTRLVLIITGVFIAAGAGLLAVQYLIVQQLFTSAISMTAASCVPAYPLSDAGQSAPAPVEDWSSVDPDAATGFIGSGTATLTGCAYFAEETTPTQPIQALDVVSVEAVGGAVLQQSSFLSDEIRGGLLTWSIVVLVAFAGVAAAIAFWLAQRSLSRIREVTAAARDISERDLARRLDLPGPDDEVKELGDTIDGMLDRLQSAFAAQDRFVANASHELRTPLTTTRTALEIPLAQGAVPPELEPGIRRALRAAEQSEKLITALLALARSGAALEHPEALDVAELIEGELAELDHGDLALHTELTSVVVDGDPLLLPRALRNLLENAVLHNTAGGEVRVRSSRDGDTAVVEVENTGSALDAATVALLTEPFYRGDATRTASGPAGTGLGLAIVDSIAEMHGGALRLTSREGGGLIASFSLPVRRAG